MKKIKALIKEERGSYEATLTYPQEFTKEDLKNENTKQRIVKDFKKFYPKASTIDLLIASKPKINKDRLMRIGQEVASCWGAVCTGVKTYENLVTFECNEYGEKFSTTISYDEIKEDYGYVE